MTDYPPPPSPEGPGVPVRAWRAFRRWPIWGQVAAWVVLAVVVIAAVSPDDETTPVAASSDTTSTISETTTTAKATTTEAPTTTLSPAQMAAAQQAVFGLLFDGQRPKVVKILEDDINVETVDRFTYDAEAGLITLDVTSGWASPDNQVDGAWEITRALASLWSKDDGIWHGSQWSPGLRFVNSGTVYNCSADLMVRLGSLEAGRTEWEAES